MMEICMARSASFVVATTNNKWIKTINFDNFTSNQKIRVEITSWSKVKTCKTPVIVDIFKFTNISPLKYCSALGLMYI